MKVIELSTREFEALDVSSQKLVFQGKTFVKDLMFSDRVYRQTVTALWHEGDDSTSCLIVHMENNYVLWHEDKAQPQTEPPVQKRTSRRLPPLSTTPRLTMSAQTGSPFSAVPSKAIPLGDSPVPASNLMIVKGAVPTPEAKPQTLSYLYSG